MVETCPLCGIYYSDQPENCPLCKTGTEAAITDFPECQICNIKALWWKCPCVKETP